MLKTVLDKGLFGRYLRFDFTKATNAGYAFVNFLTPEDLLGSSRTTARSTSRAPVSIYTPPCCVSPVTLS